MASSKSNPVGRPPKPDKDIKSVRWGMAITPAESDLIGGRAAAKTIANEAVRAAINEKR